MTKKTLLAFHVYEPRSSSEFHITGLHFRDTVFYLGDENTTTDEVRDWLCKTGRVSSPVVVRPYKD